MQPVPLAKRLAVPVEADSVEGPIITYGDGPTSINFLTAEERWGRVTFEKMDSLRVSRGEHEPYRSVDKPFGWVHVVENSPWLRERYDYERAHYGQSYEFGDDVDEMLRDFAHYVFCFHDEFVEVIAAGIWFETALKCIGNRDPDPGHPLLDLPVSSVSDHFEEHGIVCQVRRNDRPIDDLMRDAAFCSQKILQIATELDGTSSVSWTLSLRVRDGRPRSDFRSFFGKIEESFEGIATLSDVRPRVVAWLREVRERRNKRGKL